MGSRFPCVVSGMDRVSVDLLRGVENRECALRSWCGDKWNSQSQANLQENFVAL